MHHSAQTSAPKRTRPPRILMPEEPAAATDRWRSPVSETRVTISERWSTYRSTAYRVLRVLPQMNTKQPKRELPTESTIRCTRAVRGSPDPALESDRRSPGFELAFTIAGDLRSATPARSGDLRRARECAERAERASAPGARASARRGRAVRRGRETCAERVGETCAEHVQDHARLF